MVVELLVEVVGTSLVHLGALRYRVWREETFFEELPPEQQGYFLDVLLAAILHDGVTSELEQRWLDKRRELASSPAVVDAAIERARAALPAGATDEQRRAFVRAAGASMSSDALRTRAFAGAAGMLLLRDGATAAGPDSAEWAAARGFGEVLGVPNDELEPALQKLSARLTGMML